MKKKNPAARSRPAPKAGKAAALSPNPGAALPDMLACRPEPSVADSLLQVILDHAPVGIVVTDRDGRLLLINRTAQSLYGQAGAAEETEEDNDSLLLCYPNGTPCGPSQLPLTQSAREGETHINVEMCLQGVDGAWRDLLVSTAPLRNAAGELTGAVGILRDVTDLHQVARERQVVFSSLQQQTENLQAANEELAVQTEELRVVNEELNVQAEELENQRDELARLADHLETQKRLLEAVLTQMPGALLVAEPVSGRIILGSEQVARLSRHSSVPADIYQDFPLCGFRPDGTFYPCAEWPLARSLQTGEAVEGEEIDIFRGDGSRATLSVSSGPVRNRAGEIVAGVAIAFDITSRKEAEAALAESEQRYRRLVELSPDAILVQAHGRYVFANPAAARLFGADQQKKLTGRLGLELVHPDYREAVSRRIRKTTSGLTTQMREIKILRLDGTPVEVEVTGTLISFQGEPAILLVMRDITERKEAEAALRESERQAAFLADLLESSSQPFGVGFLDGRLGRFNTAYCELLGYTPEEFRALDWTGELTPPEWREHEQDMLARLLATGEPVRYEKEYFHQDGHRIPVELLVHLRRDEAGRPLLYYAFITDITARQKSQAALIRAKEEWERTFDAVPDLVAILDDQHRIVRVNRAMAVALGKSPAELEGGKCHELMHGTQAPPQFCPHSQLLADGREHATEVRVLDHDFQVSASPLTDDQGRIIGSVHVARDITAHKQAEAAIKASEARVRLKLDSILSPEGDIGTLELADIIDVPAVQSLMDDFYRLAQFPMAIIDLTGKVLVGVGWQEICTKFHRVHPDTHRHCLESDMLLSAGVPPGEFRLYKCKNHMWDIVTPIMVAGQHVGNLFSGQFFFDDDTLDYDLFRAQARQYGFDEAAYITALEAVPRLSREAVDTGMSFLVKLAGMLSKLSYSNLKLARSVQERDTLMASLTASEERLRLALHAAHAGSWEWDLATGAIIWSEEIWELYGLPKGSVTPSYETWRQTVYPEDLPFVEQTVQETVQQGIELNTEWRVADGNGSRRWLMSRGRPLQDADGQVSKYLGIVMDITARKQAEEALRRSHQRLDLLAETAGRLLSSAKPQDVVESLCQKVMSFLDCHAFFNFLADDSAGRLHLNACAGIPPEEAAKIEWLDYGVAVCGCAAQEGQRIVAEDIEHTPDPRTELVKSYGIKAYAATPLMVQGRLLGTLSFGTRSRSRFSADDLSLMQAVTDQVAIAIDRKLAEEALKESQKDLKRAQAVAHTGSWRLDVRRNVLLWSEEAYRIFGLPQGTPLTYEIFLAAVHPEDRAYVDEKWAAARRGEPYDIEHRIIVAGTVKWVRERAELEFNAAGDFLGGFGTAQDITALKEAETALKESEERYRNLFENNHAVMLLIDPGSGAIMDANPAACSYYGLDREEFKTRNITDLNVLGDEAVFQEMQRAQAQERRHFEFRHRLANGEIRDVEVLSGPIRIKGRELLYSIVHDDTARKQAEAALLKAHAELEQRVQDRTLELKQAVETLELEISERRQAEAALEHERQRLFSVLEGIPAYVALLAPDYRVVFTNREFIRRFGEAGNRRCHEFLGGSDEPCRECRAMAVFHTGKPADWEWQGPDNKTYQVYYYPFTDVGGSPLVLELGVDITDRKAAETLSKEQSALLEGINRIFQGALTCATEEELGGIALAVAAELTGAKFGFIDELNASGCLDFLAISDPGRAACKVPGTEAQQLPKHVKVRGLFASIIHQGRSLLTNNPASHPDSGLPAGHPPLTAFLGVPLFHGGRLFGHIGLGNKEGGFTAKDQETVETLALPLVEALMRFRAERQAVNLGRLYRLLSLVNEAIVRVRVRDSLFQEVCRIAVEEGLFRLAWIGLVQDGDRPLQLEAKYGFDEGYLDTLIIPVTEVPESRGPTGMAVKQGRYDVCNDIATDPRMSPWREQALARGYRSSAAFPLKVGSLIVGVLTLYSGTPEFFTAQEIHLLEALTQDLSFAMEAMDKEEKRRRAEAALKESEERLRSLASQLMRAQETERKRLALELHDDLGQSLMVLKLQVRAIEKSLAADDTATRDHCLQTLAYINEVIENVRRLSRDLRPSVLEDLGLAAGLRHLMEESGKYRNMEVVLDLDDVQGLLSPEQEIIIFRIFQESLTNIFKHARATAVQAAIKKQPGCLACAISDNGTGFNPEEVLAADVRLRGLGLAAMQERLRMLGGSFNLISRQGEGTKISFTVPVPGLTAPR